MDAEGYLEYIKEEEKGKGKVNQLDSSLQHLLHFRIAANFLLVFVTTTIVLTGLFRSPHKVFILSEEV